MVRQPLVRKLPLLVGPIHACVLKSARQLLFPFPNLISALVNYRPPVLATEENLKNIFY